MIINLNNKDYDFENDILYLYTSEGKYKESIDLNGAILDIGQDGKIRGIEIMDISKRFNVDKYDLLKNLIKFEVVIEITKDIIKLNMRLGILKRNQGIIKESTVKGLNYSELNEGRVEMVC
jgi:uncharacterized protein YuzE